MFLMAALVLTVQLRQLKPNEAQEMKLQARVCQQPYLQRRPRIPVNWCWSTAEFGLRPRWYTAAPSSLPHYQKKMKTRMDPREKRSEQFADISRTSPSSCARIPKGASFQLVQGPRSSQERHRCPSPCPYCQQGFVTVHEAC
ncbi:hypothetical protein BC629DRAFT_797788 [Irpex lacteus]|nr:hypothetical protein BC629DRAFT_797788 [Irpex lacteus]